MTGIRTIRDLRKTFSLPRATICYAIDKDDIEHAGRVGITRYWAESDVPRIREALRKTGALESAPADSEEEVCPA